MYGLYQRSHLSKHKIKLFIKQYKIDMNDYQIPDNYYKSFNQFFIRKLKLNARKINLNPRIIIAPADGKLLAIPNISLEHTFFIKKKSFNLEKFLGNKSLAQDYQNGTMIVVRLAPYDYHRFHFPVDCTPSAPLQINGILESVNPLVFKAGVNPLIENERHLIKLKTNTFDTILMIPIGAMMVGKIVETYKANQEYKKGDEAGYFAFGGSSIALIFKQEVITPRQDFIRHSLHGYETCVEMGEAINE